MRDGLSRQDRSATSFTGRSIRTRAACSRRCPAELQASGCGPSRARCRCSARSRRAARFNPRCPDRFEPCTSTPPGDYRVGPDHMAKCFLHDPATTSAAPMPLVEVSHLVKHFVRGGRRPAHGTLVKAVDDVSFASRRAKPSVWSASPAAARRPRAGACCAWSSRPSGSVRFRGEDVLGVFAPPPARSPAPHADRLPGSVLVAQPADAGAPDRRRAADHPPARRPRAPRRARVAELFRLVGLDPGTSRALPARVQRRPAAAHRPRARAGAEPVVSRPRRAGVGARRLGAGAGRSTC